MRFVPTLLLFLTACGFGLPVPRADAGPSACATTACLGGTVTVPDGHTLQGLQVLACVPNASTGACDPGQSVTTTLDAGTTSGTFALTVTDGTWYLFAGTDRDGDGTPEAGDLTGGLLTSTGAFTPVRPPQGQLQLTVFEVPPRASLDATLTGTWARITQTEALSYDFAADGAFALTYRYQPGTCVDGVVLVDVRSTGQVSATADTLQLFRLAGEQRSTACTGALSLAPYARGPQQFGYLLGLDGATGRRVLTLTPADGTAPVTLVET